MFGIKPEDENVHIVGSPLYHTAVLIFASSSMHFGHPVVLMEKWTPEDMPAPDRRSTACTTSHMVPTQFHRMLALPDGRAREVRLLARRARWCTRRRPARPT